MTGRCTSVNRETLLAAIAALQAGKRPAITPEDVPAFSEEATAGNDHMSPASLEEIVDALGPQDIPTLERAVRAIDEGDLAWLGFKVVYDPQAAMGNVDNEVTKKYGEKGSADGQSMLFFCNDAKEVVCSREPSARDLFQMKDVTRGPSMHNEQFEGLTWASVPLFESVRVWLLGASDVACELAPLAKHVGFEVVVVDCDEAYLNEQRFPDAKRILLPGGNFDALDDYAATERDYVCVLTRGHMFDPQSCIWAVKCNAHYVGMMGCKGKNNTVYDIVTAAGVTDEQWDAVKRPIGLKFGAKTPAELAIAIVGELIDVRYCERYSAEARERHEKSLGR